VIDPKLLREDPERVRASQRARGEDPSLVDAALAADERHRATLSEFERLRAEQKSFGKRVARAQGEEKQALLQQVKDLAARVKELDRAKDEAAAERERLLRSIGNVIIDGVPAGGEDDYVVLHEVGTPRDFAAEGFTPLDHLELGERLGAIDMARGAKVAGARFYYLTGVGARLETALMNLALQRAQQAGFVQLQVPTLVNRDTMAGAGFLDAHEEEVYRLRDDDLYLTGTSEVALAGFHADEIIDLGGGPRRYTAHSTCYRREAGSYGKDTRGIIRVHQFQKVELFVYCRPEDSEAEHEALLGYERGMLDDMEIPYRVIDVAAGDLGGPAARKFGVGPVPGPLPRADLHLELHDVPGPPAQRPRAGPARPRHAVRRHPQRDHGDHPVDGGDPGEPPAARRLGGGARGAAPVPRRGRPPPGPLRAASAVRRSPAGHGPPGDGGRARAPRHTLAG